MHKRDLQENYLRKSAARFKHQLQIVDAILQKYAWTRLSIVFGGLALTGVLYQFEEIWAWVTILLSIVAFIGVTYFQRKVEQLQKKYQILLDSRTTQLARMTLDWDNIPVNNYKYTQQDHPYEIDLDITGRHSLHQLLDTTVSKEGQNLLGDWLLNHQPEAVENRREIVKELRKLSGFREKFLLSIKQVSETQLEGSAFLKRLETGVYPERLNWILPIASVWVIITAILYFSGLMINDFPVWGISLSAYAIFYLLNRDTIISMFDDILFLEKELEKIKAILLFLETYPYHNCPNLSDICKSFWQPEKKPSRQLRKLQLIIAGVGLRMNPILWLLLNGLMPWDFFFAKQLETHKKTLATSLASWLEIWKNLEALIALGNFAWLSPESVFPELEKFEASKKPILSVDSASHPLIPANQRIPNSFTLNNIGDAVLITGSNMAGKSTFLKTLGVNLVLAYAGAPVIAKSFNTVHFRMFSCIKVLDSVTDGFSYFYAEVRRLKALLAALEAPTDTPLFFLIDEIFKGTNNRERFIGSRSFIKHLVGKNGIGGITTHDLDLTQLPEELPQLTNYHFRETVENGKMAFDYTLHPGPCPTTNALIIMKMEGLPVEE